MSEMFISFFCGICGHLVYITEHNTFVDQDHKPIKRCPECGLDLRVPPALEHQRNVLNTDWSEDAD